MKAQLYIKKTYSKDGDGETSHSKPMAEVEDGKHYPLFTPVQPKEMIGEQEGRVLNIKGIKMFVLGSQNNFLAQLYNPRKFVH